MNDLKFIYILSLLFISMPAMEMPVGVPANAFDRLPKAVLGYTLGFLFNPYSASGAKDIIQFLRTSAKYYRSHELMGAIMHEMRIKNHFHFNHLFASPDNIDSWKQIMFMLGTSTATAEFRNHLLKNPQEWGSIHIDYGLMLKHESRLAKLLKNAGADLNIPVNEWGETAFFVVAKTSYDSDHLQKMVAAGANINTIDSTGNNVLMALIRSAGVEEKILPCADFLITKGINVSQQTPNGETAYGIACWLQYLKVAEKIKNVYRNPSLS